MADHKPYEMNEEDIDKVICYLEIVDPENATPENAIAFLEYYQTLFHELGHQLTAEQMQKLYDEFAQKRDEPKN